MPNELFKEMSNEAFHHEFHLEKTPENVNWMYAVQQLDLGRIDLVVLLKELDDNYSGAISINEGWGGCEADSNLKLITEKIEFDFDYDPACTYARKAILEAIRLNWTDYRPDDLFAHI